VKKEECNTSSTKAEENQNSLIVREDRYRCPRCEIELEWGIINNGYCPRCAYDIRGTIDISDGLVDPQVEKDKAGQREFNDLVLMLDNWLGGYKKLIQRKGVDWSLPHEFFQEFADHMVPYISRLKKLGYSTPERMRAIGDKVVDALHEMIQAIQQEEDLMRLTGQWDDEEETIKLEWMGKMGMAERLLQ
jgi:hypothetical protein